MRDARFAGGVASVVDQVEFGLGPGFEPIRQEINKNYEFFG